MKVGDRVKRIHCGGYDYYGGQTATILEILPFQCMKVKYDCNGMVFRVNRGDYEKGKPE